MVQKSILKIKPLGFPWETLDPFIFCVHHRDEYPKGMRKWGLLYRLKAETLVRTSP